MGFWSNLKQKITKKKNEEFEENIQIDEIDEQSTEKLSDEGVIEEGENQIIVKKTLIKDNKTTSTSNNDNNKESSLKEKTIKEKVIIKEVQPKLTIKEELPEEVILEEIADILDIPSMVVEPKQVTNNSKINKKEKKKAEKLSKKIEIQNQKKKEKIQKAEKAIANSSLSFSKDIKKLSKKYKKMDDDFFEELEEILIKTDMGMKMVLKISNSLRRKIKPNTSEEEFKETLVEEIYNFYNDGKKIKPINFEENRLNVFMVIGVNGTGKTTSLSKIANFYAKQGKKVLIAAADTFRAGAVEQLEEWISSRLNNQVDLIKGLKPNQDPASVVYDAYEKAKKENYDLLLIDTAGRLQNKVNLMKELEKMYQIIRQEDKKAPHELLLVIDATTGQNGVIQAKEFDGVTDVSGIVLTKMDGTSKGGIALAIKDELDIPVKLVGIGEQVDDLIEFDVDEYIYGLTVGFMENNDNEE